MKYGENALRARGSNVRYAEIGHFYCSILQGGLLNGSRLDEDSARPTDG
jgi:hypothetical protein